MRIQPINNTNYPNYAKINNKTIDNISAPSVSNVSFGSLSSLLLYAVAKEGVSTLSKRKHYEFLKNLDKHIFSSDIEKFKIGINALTKTPNSLYDNKFSRIGILNSLADYNINFVQDLRWKGLKKIHLIGDSNYINVQTKKDFLMSLFENGHPISPTFVKQFANLDDRVYCSFKQNIIDTALYSTRYNEQRCNNKAWYNDKWYVDSDSIYPEEYEFATHGLYSNITDHYPYHWGQIGAAFQNLKLIASLNKDIYGSLIAQRKNSIEEMKYIIECCIKDFRHAYTGNWSESSAKPFHDDFYNNLKTL